MQGRADADHARTQYEHIGLEFRHPGTPKVVCRKPAPAAYTEVSYCGIVAPAGSNPQGNRPRELAEQIDEGKSALARRLNSGNMDR
jgi:hypothetical protein